jgi:CubicO group peptidase (beta-lactamase class C family)
MTELVPSLRVVSLRAMLTLSLLVGSAERHEIHSQGVTVSPDVAARAKAYMQARVGVTEFSGVVLVARSGVPLFRAAYGLANRAFDVANSPETKFRLGSVTKQFTAEAILLLASRGQLQLDDPVGRYLSNWPPGWSALTVRHLLTHTAGLPRLTSAWPLQDVSALGWSVLPTKPQSILDLATAAERAQPLDFTPGENFAYSNIGYVLLGEIVERVSGRPFGVFMQQEVLQPLGMIHTGVEDPRAIEPLLATGYERTGTAFTEAGYVDLRLVGGAGALYSTVDDLLRWDQGLASGRLLPAAVQEAMFTPARSDYAMGWWIQRQLGRAVQWHRGTVQGFQAFVLRYPSESLFVAVLSNTQGTPVKAIGNELASLALGEPYETPRAHRPARLDTAALERFVGEYSRADDDSDRFAISRDSTRLYLEIPVGRRAFEIFAESPTEAFATWGEYYLRFDWATKTVVIRNDGLEVRWRRR